MRSSIQAQARTDLCSRCSRDCKDDMQLKFCQEYKASGGLSLNQSPNTECNTGVTPRHKAEMLKKYGY